ncbi:hypothetical protein P175DRAFT_0553374 [Aspergillus ochraceoroseus IBT 24754]|uniref:Uncharacterized protein n=1 Tax=Aspergillus ochraceoroseus IBT 24754 TaxID=1392256 RepID=A0A2T5M6D1_9EURO|nr:uncharacterized protein P175DRAFT_0553374 [Aspergillus ochraceoroseus IBT 24754]PTU24090.1 hypothetical protein P175DRAFT_0553374 [Aspergillus ochraceoroseus IBT 24754]
MIWNWIRTTSPSPRLSIDISHPRKYFYQSPSEFLPQIPLPETTFIGRFQLRNAWLGR